MRKPMDVYLVQHGQAVFEEQDPERPLSDDGRTAVMKVARYIAAPGGRIHGSATLRGLAQRQVAGGADGGDSRPGLGF